MSDLFTKLQQIEDTDRQRQQAWDSQQQSSPAAATQAAGRFSREQRDELLKNRDVLAGFLKWSESKYGYDMKQYDPAGKGKSPTSKKPDPTGDAFFGMWDQYVYNVEQEQVYGKSKLTFGTVDYNPYDHEDDDNEIWSDFWGKYNRAPSQMEFESSKDKYIADKRDKQNKRIATLLGAKYDGTDFQTSDNWKQLGYTYDLLSEGDAERQALNLPPQSYLDKYNKSSDEDVRRLKVGEVPLYVENTSKALAEIDQFKRAVSDLAKGNKLKGGNDGIAQAVADIYEQDGAYSTLKGIDEYEAAVSSAKQNDSAATNYDRLIGKNQKADDVREPADMNMLRGAGYASGIDGDTPEWIKSAVSAAIDEQNKLYGLSSSAKNVFQNIGGWFEETPYERTLREQKSGASEAGSEPVTPSYGAVNVDEETALPDDYGTTQAAPTESGDSDFQKMVVDAAVEGGLRFASGASRNQTDISNFFVRRENRNVNSPQYRSWFSNTNNAMAAATLMYAAVDDYTKNYQPMEQVGQSGLDTRGWTQDKIDLMNTARMAASASEIQNPEDFFLIDPAKGGKNPNATPEERYNNIVQWATLFGVDVPTGSTDKTGYVDPFAAANNVLGDKEGYDKLAYRALADTKRPLSDEIKKKVAEGYGIEDIVLGKPGGGRAGYAGVSIRPQNWTDDQIFENYMRNLNFLGVVDDAMMNAATTTKLTNRANYWSQRRQSDKALVNLVGDAVSALSSNAPGIITSAIPGGQGISMATFITNAAGQYAEEARQDGASYNQQLTYGAIGGTVEGLSEYLAIPESVLAGSTIKPLVRGAFQLGKRSWKTAAKVLTVEGGKALLHASVEPTQEVFTDLAANFLKKELYAPDTKVVDWEQHARTAASTYIYSMMLAMVGLGGGNSHTSKYLQQQLNGGEGVDPALLRNRLRQDVKEGVAGAAEIEATLAEAEAQGDATAAGGGSEAPTGSGSQVQPFPVEGQAQPTTTETAPEAAGSTQPATVPAIPNGEQAQATPQAAVPETAQGTWAVGQSRAGNETHTSPDGRFIATRTPQGAYVLRDKNNTRAGGVVSYHDTLEQATKKAAQISKNEGAPAGRATQEVGASSQNGEKTYGGEVSTLSDFQNDALKDIADAKKYPGATEFVRQMYRELFNDARSTVDDAREALLDIVLNYKGQKADIVPNPQREEGSGIRRSVNDSWYKEWLDKHGGPKGHAPNKAERLQIVEDLLHDKRYEGELFPEGTVDKVRFLDEVEPLFDELLNGDTQYVVADNGDGTFTARPGETEAAGAASGNAASVKMPKLRVQQIAQRLGVAERRSSPQSTTTPLPNNQPGGRRKNQQQATPQPRRTLGLRGSGTIRAINDWMGNFKNRIKTPSDIVNMLAEHFAVNIDTPRFGQTRGARKLPGLQGYFNIRERFIKLKDADSLETTFHEVGHTIDFDYDLQGEMLENLAAGGHANDVLSAYLTPEVRSNYKPAQWNREAIAGFFVDYVFNPSRARANAPEFFTLVERTLSKNDLKVLNGVQRATEAWLALPDQERLRQTIVSYEKRKPNRLPADLMNRAIIRIANSNHGFIPFEDLAAQMGWENKGINSPLQQARLARHVSGVSGYVMERELVTPTTTTNDTPKPIEYEAGLVDENHNPVFKKDAAGTVLKFSWDPVANTKVVDMVNGKPEQVMEKRKGLSFNDLFKWIKSRKKRIDFRAYLVARIAVERAAADKVAFSAEDVGDAQKLVEQFEKENPEFAQHAQEFYAWWDAFMTHWLVKTGLLPKTQYQAMRDKYPSYVPLFRDKSNSIRQQFFGVGSGLNNITAPIRGAKGGTDKIMDPVGNMMRSIENVAKAVYRRNALLAVYNVVHETEGMSLFAYEIKRDTKVSEVDISGRKNVFAQQIEDDLESGAITEEVADYAIQLMENNFDDIVKAFSLERKTKDEAEFMVLTENGKIRWMRTENPMFLDTLASFEQSDDVRKVFRIISAPMRFVMSSITGKNPFFAITRNIFRDFQEGFVWGAGKGSWNPAKYVKDYAVAFADAFMEQFGKNGFGVSREYGRFGGGHGAEGIVGTTRSAARTMREFYSWDALTTWEKVRRAWGSIGGFVENLNNAIDEIPRLVEYKRAKEQGATGLEAFNRAQDVTLDFFQSGTWAPALKPFVMFFNAAAQDTYKSYMLVDDVRRNPKNPEAKAKLGRVLGRSLVLYGLLTVLENAWNSNDDEWQSLPQGMKERYWNFKVGPALFVHFPKPSGIMAQFVASFSSRTGQAIRGDDRTRDLFNAGYGYDLFRSIWPSFVGQPALDILMNQKWTGAAIETQTEQRNQPWARYNENTSEISKALSKSGASLGMSPKQIEYLLEQTTGVYADVLLPLFTKGAEGGPGEIMMRQMFGNATYSNKYAGQYYDLKNRLTQAYSTAQAEGEAKGIKVPASQYVSRYDTAGIAKLISDLDKQLKDLRDKEKGAKTFEQKQLIRIKMNKAYERVVGKLQLFADKTLR